MSQDTRQFTAEDIAIAAARRLAGMHGALDPGWVAAIAAGTALATPGSFTIETESGQRFTFQVTEGDPDA